MLYEKVKYYQAALGWGLKIGKKIVFKDTKKINSAVTEIAQIFTCYITSRRIQWALNTKLVWYSNRQKEVGCQMVLFFNVIWMPGSPTIWLPDKWSPSCFLIYWSSIWMVGLGQPIEQPFEIWTSKISVFKCCSNGRYSDPHCSAQNYVFNLSVPA